MMTQRLLPALVLAAAASASFAKLPPPDPATKAKADEAAAKAAWQGKVDSYLQCKVQDRLAARYGTKNSTAKAASVPVAAMPAGTKAAAASAPAAAASASAAAGDKPTPVAAGGAPPAPCQDPGPFVFNPPSQTPLETSGAHSPAGNAVSPPSVRPESATMAPAKK